MTVQTQIGKVIGVLLAVQFCPGLAAAPYATQVISYTQGTGLTPSEAAFNDPQAALGWPERFSGQGTPYPSVVSMFSPLFNADQAVALGDGGSLVLKFDQPITNDPAHPYGVDFIVFGNAGFILGDFFNLRIASPAELFGDGRGRIEVSEDGIVFHEIPNIFADQLFPTQGYLDGGPFDPIPGSIPADFRKPMNPALTLGDFSGLSYEQALALYDGSGGGLPVDIGVIGMNSVSFVRISHSGEGDTEIDAIVVVPEPCSGLLAVLLAALSISLRIRGRRMGALA